MFIFFSVPVKFIEKHYDTIKKIGLVMLGLVMFAIISAGSQIFLQKKSSTEIAQQDAVTKQPNSTVTQQTPELTNKELYQIGSSATGLIFGLKYQDFVGLGESRPFLASGVLISEDGIVATNYHVIKNAGLDDIVFEGGIYAGQVFDKIIAVSPLHDLALLHLAYGAENGLHFVPVVSSDDVSVGDDVFAIGNPEGYINSFSNGVVSGIRYDEDSGSEYIGTCFQISAAISHGSSGGALLNKRGELIGITFGGLSDGQNINFAIPSRHLLELISKSGVRTSYTTPESNSTTLRCQEIVNNLQAIYSNIDGDFVVSITEGEECGIILTKGADPTDTNIFSPELYWYNKRTGERYIVMENDLSNVVFLPAWSE